MSSNEDSSLSTRWLISSFCSFKVTRTCIGEGTEDGAGADTEADTGAGAGAGTGTGAGAGAGAGAGTGAGADAFLP